MRAQRLIAVLFALAAFTSAPAEPIVRAADYDAFWLWAGVRGRPGLEKAKSIYLLQGEIGADGAGSAQLKAQGAVEPGPHRPKLWLAYRVRSLEWTPEIVALIVRRLASWRAQKGEVAGIQLDFDASTRGLNAYSEFLRGLRQSLPADCALSVTGLMDWASRAAPEDLDALSGTVDEIVFQTYRGRATVDDIDAYVARLGRLHIPYRLGLSEGSTWSAPAGLADRPNFLGYVIFLRNAPPDAGASAR